MLYLYVKTHLSTGLKYLGMTSKDPYKYSGSGLHWKRHLKLHGKEHSTEIIHECQTLDEIKQVGTYYSDLWNIVESNEWANMKPETGDGAPSGKYHHYKQIGYNSTHHSMYGKKHKQSSIELNRAANTGENNPNYGTRWINNGIQNKKIKHDDIITDGWVIGRIINHNFGKRDKNNSKNPNYDFVIRTFEHSTGIIERCTQRELINKYSLRESSVCSLIKGNLKSTSGWKINHG
jgi:hypothetical protein